MNNWLLVANSRQAKIFSVTGTHYELNELANFVYPVEGRHGDNPAGHISAASKGTRHGMEPRTLPKEKETQAFAAELAQYLQREFSQRHFSELTLAAAPEFLGELHSALTERVRAVAKTINKDLTACSDAELSTYLHEQSALH